MLERGLLESYNFTFVGKLHAGEASTSDLYTVTSEGSVIREFLWSMFRSLSVLPFYAVVVGTVLLAWLLIL